MTIQRLNNTTDALKYVILDLIATHDMTNDREARAVLIAIDDAMDQMGEEMETVVPPDLVRQYYKGFDDAESQMGITDITQAIREDGSINPAVNRQIHVQALESIVEDTMLDLNAAYRTFRMNATGSIENALGVLQAGVAGRIITGRSKREVAKQVQQAFLKEGQTAFITRDGKRLPLDYYSRNVTYTKMAQADADGHLNRYTESEIDLVRIIGNDPTCEHCAAHRGMVYSISGNTPGFSKLPDNLIPFHNFCQCSFSPVSWDYLTTSEKDAINKRLEKGVDYNIRDKKEIEQYEEFQAINRRNNAEKKLFSRMQVELGADMPESLGAFRRAKRSGTLRYKELYSNYLSATHTES